jgi:hypothetical protein
MLNRYIFKSSIVNPFLILILHIVFAVSFVQASPTIPVQILFSGNIQGETEPCG